jgi:hypothetical protein
MYASCGARDLRLLALRVDVPFLSPPSCVLTIDDAREAAGAPIPCECAAWYTADRCDPPLRVLPGTDPATDDATDDAEAEDMIERLSGSCCPPLLP